MSSGSRGARRGGRCGVTRPSDGLGVQGARNKVLCEQRFSRGVPLGPLEVLGAAPNRRGTSSTFHPDAEIFGHHTLRPSRLFKMVRSKAYLFSGVEIRWKSEIAESDTPQGEGVSCTGGVAGCAP